MLLIGPTLLSGIGQHLKKYEMVIPNSKYVELSDNLPDDEEGAIVFALPVDHWLIRIPILKEKYNRLFCMTVCETETVHEDYGKLFTFFEKILVPSEFCKKVFQRQFPDTEFIVVHAHIPFDDTYTFYHIGNIRDQRKNFKDILEAFIRLNEPKARLLVKATCRQEVNIPLPNVKVVNGLISEEEINNIHKMGDCYVSFSSSEGVGMGAVEAAVKQKPVIITDYGGAPEYIKTPYTIPCTLRELDNDDFLFKKGMEWGNPDSKKLFEFMKHAFDNRVKFMDHTHTRELVCNQRVLDEFVLHDVLRYESDQTSE